MCHWREEERNTSCDKASLIPRPRPAFRRFPSLSFACGESLVMGSQLSLTRKRHLVRSSVFSEPKKFISSYPGSSPCLLFGMGRTLGTEDNCALTTALFPGPLPFFVGLHSVQYTETEVLLALFPGPTQLSVTCRAGPGNEAKALSLSCTILNAN